MQRLPWSAIALLLGCLILLGWSAEEHFPTASGHGPGTSTHSAGVVRLHHPTSPDTSLVPRR